MRNPIATWGKITRLRINKDVVKRFILGILLAAVTSVNIPVVGITMDENTKKIRNLVNIAVKEREWYGDATDETINNLYTELQDRGIDVGSYSGMQSVEFIDAYDSKRNNGIVLRGYGENHKIDKTWSYRVDKPSTGNAKPHVHVYKNGKQVGVENVDGTSSHGKTLKNVPKNVRNKVRNSKDYEKGKSDLKKMKQAKAEIKKKKLNLKNAKELIIAAGIFLAIVGVVFFAPEALPAALLVI